MTPRLVSKLIPLLCHEPQRGSQLTAVVHAEPEDVFEALAWMEARGIAELKPYGAVGGYHFAGWVIGRNQMLEAA